MKAFSKVRAVASSPVTATSTELTFVPLPCPKTRLIQQFEGAACTTLADVWDWSVRRYPDKKLLGTRDILGEEDEVQTNGKMFKKLELGDYRWMTYEEVDSMADSFGRGLRTLGQKPGENLCLLADTRMEWLVAAQASFRQSFPVVTIYTNLGEEAARHGLVETGVELVITSHELLPRFKKILQAGGQDKVKTIVYMTSPIHRTPTTGFREGVEVISFWDVVSRGKKTANNNMADSSWESEPVRPSADTPAIIMYTSGSTGTPKVRHRPGLGGSGVGGSGSLVCGSGSLVICHKFMYWALVWLS